ncbi:MAG: GNAT family N-acetyltransferase [Parachlamydiaceae bacterium]
MSDSTIKTERLILRSWREEDLEPFARLNADPRVMEFFPRVLSQEESHQFAQRICIAMKEQGWGLWAVSIPDVADFIGYIGLAPVNFVADFSPAVEVGWRLAYDFWNNGYATEGAKAAVKYGFENLHLNEIVSFTAINNRRSRRVMEKIGMYHDENSDFDHPKLPERHELRRHALYRIRTGHFTQIWELPPENFQPHVEVAACYVEMSGRILLMQRASNSAEGKTWGVPAGKIEAGETPHQGAIRELIEETSIKVSSCQVKEIGKLYVRKPSGDYIYHMFEVNINKIPQVILSSEHTQYLWANAEDIKGLHLIGGGRGSLKHYARMKK